jgi:Domain of unknown function (DUF4314)
LFRLAITPNVVGKRIKLIRTDDPYLNPGDRGTVVDVSELPYEDMTFKLLVQWDSGSRHPILEGRDDYRMVYDGEDD